jgi:hypothetical protein
MIEHQAVTSCIVHLADSANFKGVASNKLCNGLTGLCFESPNDTIHVTVVHHNKNCIVIILTLKKNEHGNFDKKPETSIKE